MKIKILVPVYNDWQSAFKLLENIDSEIANLEEEISVVIVDDASTEQRPEMNFNLKDLKSRAKNSLVAKIENPDDQLIKVLLAKNFSDRQIKIDNKLIDTKIIFKFEIFKIL